jgi:hypothetical protein
MHVHGMQAFCDKEHYIEYAAKNRKALAKKGEKMQNKEAAAKKRVFKANDKPLRIREADKACNRYIRQRDDKEPCISCQRHHKGQYHAGHYIPKGRNSALRYNEKNLHKQCMPCNSHLSGNLTNYRINLIKKIGLEAVEELENNSEIKRYTCEEVKQIETEYKQKYQELIK